MTIEKVSIEKLYKSMSDFMRDHKIVSVTSFMNTAVFGNTFTITKKYLCENIYLKNTVSCTEITKILYEECEGKTSDLKTVLTSRKVMQIEWHTDDVCLVANIPVE